MKDQVKKIGSAEIPVFYVVRKRNDEVFYI